MGSMIGKTQQNDYSNSDSMETSGGFKEFLKGATKECQGFIEYAPNLKYDNELDHGPRSDIFKATDDNNNYFIKMFEISIFQKSFEIEAAIYTCVTNELLKNFNTLFLVENVTFIKCDGLLDRLKAYQRFLEKEENELTSNIKLILSKLNTSTESIGTLFNNSYGDTFDKYIGKNYLLPMDYADILFQVTWTLACFSEILMRHNDLDPKHIFLTPVESFSIDSDVEAERPTYIYELSGRNGNSYFVQRPRFHIRLFHYEKSNIMNYLPNPDLDQHCGDGEGCNVHNNGFDLYTFICKLRSKIPEFRYGANHVYKTRTIQTNTEEDSHILSDIYDFFEIIMNRQKFIESNNKCFPKGMNQYSKEQISDLSYFGDEKEVVIPLDYKNLLMRTPLFQRFLDKNLKSSQGLAGIIMRLPNNDQRMKIKNLVVKKFPELVVLSKELPDPNPDDFSIKPTISEQNKRGKQESRSKSVSKPGYFYSEKHKMWLPEDMCFVPRKKT